MIAALFVATGGVYFGIPGVDPWDVGRDARRYMGRGPVVAHPPCERWGRYWSGGPSARARRELGDDGGCFRFALSAVESCGGVLEHPEASKAFGYFALPRPPRSGGWVRGDRGWSCCVEQGHYGHRARKATWLYFVGSTRPQALIWGPSSGERLDEGFHSKNERATARLAGVAPRKRLTVKECSATPPLFRDLLLEIARSANGPWPAREREGHGHVAG